MAEAKKSTQERKSRRTINQELTKKRKEHKPRSSRYLAIEEKIHSQEGWKLEDAIQFIKDHANLKFDSSVELHIHLTPKKGKKGAEDEYMRGIFHLPHGLGKSRKVVILNEEMIDTIAKTQKLDFDVALAAPSLMPKMGKVAKILGTKGKMPNPKAGTVTDNPEAVKAEIEAGRVEYRQDPSRNIHQMIGKTSTEAEKLVENAQTVLKNFTRNRIDSATLTSTMGPGLKLNLDA